MQINRLDSVTTHVSKALKKHVPCVFRAGCVTVIILRLKDHLLIAKKGPEIITLCSLQSELFNEFYTTLVCM